MEKAGFVMTNGAIGSTETALVRTDPEYCGPEQLKAVLEKPPAPDVLHKQCREKKQKEALLK